MGGRPPGPKSIGGKPAVGPPGNPGLGKPAKPGGKPGGKPGWLWWGKWGGGGPMLAVVVDAPDVAGVKGELVAIDVGELGELCWFWMEAACCQEQINYRTVTYSAW